MAQTFKGWNWRFGGMHKDYGTSHWDYYGYGASEDLEDSGQDMYVGDYRQDGQRCIIDDNTLAE